MKEYIVRCGLYRHFIVKANSEKQARTRFKLASSDYFSTRGFTEKDITAIELSRE